MAETPSQSVKAPLRLQSAAESLGAFYEWFATASGAMDPELARSIKLFA